MLRKMSQKSATGNPVGDPTTNTAGYFAQGYTCTQCGLWVMPGVYHQCGIWNNPSPMTIYYQHDPQLLEAVKELTKAVEKLSKKLDALQADE